MKKFARYSLLILLLLLGFYLLGPAPEPPVLELQEFELPNDLKDLELHVINTEKNIDGLKENNQARIVWSDSIPQKTEWSVVYLHGFSASPEEGDGLHREFANRYGANLYLARLHEHGIERGLNNMVNMTAESLLESANKAVEIGKKLGNNVLVMSSSTGSTLALILASKDPDIKALLNYSPNIELFDKTSTVLTKPWGLQLAKLIEGDDHRSWEPENEYHNQYWTCKYRYEAIVEMKLLLDYGMTEDTFKDIHQPVFNAYWPEDQVISVEAIIDMHDMLGTPEDKSVLKAFPKAGKHMMISSRFSMDLDNIKLITYQFAEDILGMSRPGSQEID